MNYIKVISVSTLFFCLQSRALPIDLRAVEKKILSQINSQIKNNPTPKVSQKTCASFAGRWVGECIDQDGVKEIMDVSIQQRECEEIIFTSQDGEGTIGSNVFSTDGSALSSETKTKSKFALALIQTLKWSQDRQILFLDTVLMTNSALLPTAFKLKASGQLMLDSEGSLIEFIKIDQDFEPNHQERTCTLKRQ
jgi:hypothetical protein